MKAEVNNTKLRTKMRKDKKFDLYEFHHIFDDDILLLFKGPFTKHILSVFSKYIEGIVNKYPKVSKKIFSVFIELAQNIAYYSDDTEAFTPNDEPIGSGTLVIGELKDNYTFFTGNAVKNKNLNPVIKKCEIINSLDRNGLRKYRREQLNLPPGPKGSAHIGLIQVALTAGGQFDIEVTPIDDERSFFAIIVKINKN